MTMETMGSMILAMLGVIVLIALTGVIVVLAMALVAGAKAGMKTITGEKEGQGEEKDE